MEHGAMGCRTSAETMALYETCKASAFTGSNDVHPIIGLENLLYYYLVPYAKGLFSFLDSELPKDANRRHACFFELPRTRLVHSRRTDELYKSQLDGVVSVPVLHLLLNHHTGASLDDGSRDNRTVLLKNLGHPQLNSNQSIHHGYY
jgi:hypothetical protein